MQLFPQALKTARLIWGEQVPETEAELADSTPSTDGFLDVMTGSTAKVLLPEIPMAADTGDIPLAAVAPPDALPNLVQSELLVALPPIMKPVSALVKPASGEQSPQSRPEIGAAPVARLIEGSILPDEVPYPPTTDLAADAPELPLPEGEPVNEMPLPEAVGPATPSEALPYTLSAPESAPRPAREPAKNETLRQPDMPSNKGQNPATAGPEVERFFPEVSEGGGRTITPSDIEILKAGQVTDADYITKNKPRPVLIADPLSPPSRENSLPDQAPEWARQAPAGEKVPPVASAPPSQFQPASPLDQVVLGPGSQEDAFRKQDILPSKTSVREGDLVPTTAAPSVEKAVWPPDFRQTSAQPAVNLAAGAAVPRHQTFLDVAVESLEAAANGSALEFEEIARTATVDRARPEPALARSIVSQVIHSVTRSQPDGVIEVRLQPEELGRIRLTMVSGEAGLTIQVAAERPETLDLIRRNIDMLESDLKDQGFLDMSFSFGAEDQADTRDFQGENSGGEFASDSQWQSGLRVDVSSAKPNLENGRLDIRV